MRQEFQAHLNSDQKYQQKFVEAWADYYMRLSDSPSLRTFLDQSNLEQQLKQLSAEQTTYLDSLNKAIQFNVKNN